MKFNEKLTNLRKQNNKSQEQLADKLGVSRQAVSKWESGVSIPDMEKMMQLCKIFNCSLEDLVDDGVGGAKKQNTETLPNWNIYYKEILDFITKTLNMFWSMRLIEKVKCILEMLFLILIIFLFWTFAGNIIRSCFYPILSLLPDVIYRFIYSISSLIYQVFGIIAGAVLIIHIFKIRYLDYFITIEDEEIKEKVKETPIEEKENKMKQQEQRQFIEKKKNKIIIRDAKHSTYSFFGILAKLVVYFLKFLLILFAIPCIICFVVITFLAICSIWYLKDGLIFLGILLAILGAILINYIVLKVIYYFIFEIKHSFKKLFMFIISGLILISMGGSIAFCNYISFKKITISDKDYIITNHELSYKDGLVLEFLKYNNVTIVEDNTQTRIKIEVKHDPNSKETLFSNQHISSIRDEEGNYLGTNSYDVFDIGIDYTYDGIDGINYLLKMLKNKERFDLKQDIGAHQITITASKDILDKLDENYSQLFYQ